MTDLPRVVRAQKLGPYRLKLWFSDGHVGAWDFSYVTEDPGEFMRPFQDPAFFDRVWIEFGALTWPNGYDLSPVALHREMTDAGALALDAAKAA